MGRRRAALIGIFPGAIARQLAIRIVLRSVHVRRPPDPPAPSVSAHFLTVYLRPLCRFAARAIPALAAASVLTAQQSASDLLREPPTRARVQSRDDLSQVIPIYLPPHPPPLGSAVDRSASLLNLKWLAPADLHAFVNEPFYPRIATHLIVDSIPPAVMPRYQAFLANRDRLRRELADTLAGLREEEPDARLAALEAFAQRQTPALADLEWTAERLRRDLGTPHVQWNEDHRDSLRQKSRPPAEKGRRWEYEIVVSAAFFTEGLSPGQRRLLREAAIELEGIPDSRSAQPADWPEDRLLFFSPDTSRVYFPADLPAGVAGLLEAYEKEKAALKRELRNALVELDDIRSDSRVTESLRELAREHEPRLAALEESAEEIRRAAAAVWRPDTEDGTVPPDLAARWEALRTQREELNMEVVRRVEALRGQLLTFVGPFDTKRLPDGRTVASVDVRDVPGTRDFVALTGQPPAPWLKAVFKLLKTELDAADAAVAERRASLDEQEAGVLRDLERISGLPPEMARAALRRHERAQRIRGPHAGYAMAVLEPGLSPEQRRLLFDAAMERLALPLPGGSYFPYPVVR